MARTVYVRLSVVNASHRCIELSATKHATIPLEAASAREPDGQAEENLAEIQRFHHFRGSQRRSHFDLGLSDTLLPRVAEARGGRRNTSGGSNFGEGSLFFMYVIHLSPQKRVLVADRLG